MFVQSAIESTTIGAHASDPALHVTMPFDALNDISPVVEVVTGPNVIVVKAAARNDYDDPAHSRTTNGPALRPA